MAAQEPGLVGSFLTPLGLEGHKESAVLLPIDSVFSCACVCTTWLSACDSVEGLLVPPIALKHTVVPQDIRFVDRYERAERYKNARMRATVQALAWCLRRFPRTRAIHLTGWIGQGWNIDQRVLMESLDNYSWCLDLDFHEAWPWLDDLLAMALGMNCPCLESLRGCRVSKSLSKMALANLAVRCPRLQHIKLQGLEMPVGAAELWQMHFVFPNCLSLDLSFNDSFGDAALRALARKSRKLQYLSISHTSVSDDGIRLLSQGLFPDLRGLAVGGLNISNPILDEFVLSETISRLRTISFYCQDINTTHLKHMSERCSMLTELQLDNDDDEGHFQSSDLIEFLHKMDGRLEALNVGPIFNDAVAHVVGACCPRLRHFRIGMLDEDSPGRRFTDAGLTSILQSCPLLEGLDIEGCKKLSLYGRRWKKGPVAFAQLLGSFGQQLKFVIVHGCSFRALDLLRKTLPKTFFDHNGNVDFEFFEYQDIAADDSFLETYGVYDSDNSFEDDESEFDDESEDDDDFPYGPRQGRGRGTGRGQGATPKPKAKAKVKAAPKAKAKSRRGRGY